MAITTVPLTGKLTAPGSGGIAVRGTVAAFPNTTNYALSFSADNENTLGPVVGEVQADGTFELDIPVNSDQQASLLWTIVVKTSERVPGLNKTVTWTPGTFAISAAVDLADLEAVAVTSMTETALADFAQMVTDAETARDEAVAVGNTNDTIIASRIEDPASATSGALSATIAAPARSHIQHRLAGTTEPGPFIAWTADDGYTSFVDYFALLDTKGINGTLFLTKNWVNKAGTDPTWTDTYITQSQVQTIADNGHELATHGVNHEALATYRTTNGDAALHALVQEGVTYIESTFGVEVKTGAYPAGNSDRRTREIVGRTHEFYRGTKGAVAARGQDPFDVLSIDIQALSEAAIKAYVDQAVTDSALVVFLIHGMSPATKAAALTKFGNVMDYATSLGVRQGSFYEGMAERTAFRGPAASTVDTSGHAFFQSVRANRLIATRNDNITTDAWLDVDELTNIPYFDSSAGNTWEFRKPLRSASTFYVGQRAVFPDGVTTSGSAVVTSATAEFDDADIGRTITGAGIPGGATILSRQSGTQITMSANATATATGVSITLGRPARPSAVFAGDALYYQSMRLLSASNPTVKLQDLSGADVAFYSQTSFGRSGAGGAMTWDTGTGGSTATVKAFRQNLIDHTGARKLAFVSTTPTDASMANGEMAIYADTTTGAVKLKFKAKDSAGTVYNGEVALA